MHLTALPQLQTMLQIAKEFIRIRQVMKILPADVFLVVQFLQGEQRATRLQL